MNIDPRENGDEFEDAKDHVGCDLHAISSGIVTYDADARDDGTVIVDYTSGEEGWRNVMSFECDTHGVRVRAENVEGV